MSEKMSAIHRPHNSLGDTHWAGQARESVGPDLADSMIAVWPSIVTAEGFGGVEQTSGRTSLKGGKPVDGRTRPVTR